MNNFFKNIEKDLEQAISAFERTSQIKNEIINQLTLEQKIKYGKAEELGWIFKEVISRSVLLINPNNKKSQMLILPSGKVERRTV